MTAHKVDYRALNGRTEHYEFGGPIMVGLIMLTLPFVVLGLNGSCDATACPHYDSAHYIRLVQDLPHGLGAAAVAYAGWLALLLTCWVVIPGPMVPGLRMRDGKQLEYKMNGLRTLGVVLALYAAAVYYRGRELVAFVDSYFLQLAVVAIAVSLMLTTFVYVLSLRDESRALLTDGGNTGNVIYDMYFGRLLNPRLGSFDIKQFCELRPGLFLWLVLNLTFILKQYYALHGHVTRNLLLVAGSQILYIIDSVWFEPSVLTTMDIVSDGFGFMLSFGDLAWVPFVYTLQARYLSMHAIEFSVPAVLGLVALQSLGFYVFRAANSQKNAFRNDPQDPAVRDLPYIATERGSRLLCGGWWGISRHINYLGDWTMAWSYCLPCGFDSPIPYFYVAYFAILLLHRERRDEFKCSEKYGSDWARYKEKVPYRIIPYLY